MGQHYVSTLEILTRLVREVYRETFMGTRIRFLMRFLQRTFGDMSGLKRTRVSGAFLRGNSLKRDSAGFSSTFWRTQCLVKPSASKMPSFKFCGASAELGPSPDTHMSTAHMTVIAKFLAPDLSPTWLTAIMRCNDLAKQVMETLSRDYIRIDETRLKGNYIEQNISPNFTPYAQLWSQEQIEWLRSEMRSWQVRQSRDWHGLAERYNAKLVQYRTAGAIAMCATKKKLLRSLPH